MRRIKLHPKPLLSVLICHLHERKDKLNRLLNQIFPQVANLPVEILINDGDGSTGRKRNECLSEAVAPYAEFKDDDDEISTSYYERVFPYLNGKICSVGYNVKIRHGDKSMKMICCAAVTEFRQFDTTIWRPITHLQPFKKDLAVSFMDTSKGEDVYWNRAMIPIFSRNKSAYIDEELYYYNRDGR